jgi:hypothetical protein
VAAIDWAWSHVTRFVAARRTMSRQVESPAYAYEIAPDDRIGDAYNERGFHYFLAVEQKRAVPSLGTCLLLLVKLEGASEQALSAPLAERLFATLTRCLRETDFTGWYQEGFVAGAVLTQLGPAGDAVDAITARVQKALGETFTPAIASRFELAVYPLTDDVRASEATTGQFARVLSPVAGACEVASIA